jgi:hypothetical protein
LSWEGLVFVCTGDNQDVVWRQNRKIFPILVVRYSSGGEQLAQPGGVTACVDGNTVTQLKRDDTISDLNNSYWPPLPRPF